MKQILIQNNFNNQIILSPILQQHNKIQIFDGHSCSKINPEISFNNFKQMKINNKKNIQSCNFLKKNISKKLFEFEKSPRMKIPIFNKKKTQQNSLIKSCSVQQLKKKNKSLLQNSLSQIYSITPGKKFKKIQQHSFQLIKKQQLVRELLLKNQSPISTEMRSLIEKSVESDRKIRKQNLQQKLEEIKLKKQKSQLIKEQDKIIREKNRNRFQCKSERKIQIPWGFNQITFDKIVQNVQLIQNDSKRKLVEHEDRRQRIGVQFLNHLSDEQLKLKFKKKSPKVEPVQQKPEIKRQFRKITIIKEEKPDNKIEQNLKKLFKHINKIRKGYKIKKHKIAKKQYQQFEQLKQEYDSIISQEKQEQIQIHQIFQNMAIIIQKIWRGYRTRKLLKEYYEQWMIRQQELIRKQDNDTIIEDEKEDQLDSIQSEKKIEQIKNYENQVEKINQEYLEKFKNLKSKISKTSSNDIQIVLQDLMLELENNIKQIEKNIFYSSNDKKYTKKKLSIEIETDDLNSEIVEVKQNKKQDLINFNNLARLTLGSEKMVKYLQKSQLSSSWSTPFKSKRSPNFLINKSDINVQIDYFCNKLQESFFNTEPYERFAEKIYSKMNDKCEREKLYDFIKLKKRENYHKSPQLKKKKDYIEKWVEPKILTPTPKSSKKLVFSLENQTERGLNLQLKVNSLKQIQKNDAYISNENSLNPLNDLNQFSKSKEKNRQLDNILISPPQQDHKKQINLKLKFDNDDLIQEKMHQEFQTISPINHDGNLKFEITTKNKQLKTEKKFEPSIENISNYIDQLNQYIIENYLQSFIANINKPKNSDLKYKLQFLRSQKFESYQKQFEEQSCQLISNKIFQKLNNQKSLEQYHNKMIFDNLIEALEYFRPFDIRGQNLPWKVNEKKLTYSKINVDNVHIVFEQAKNKIMENAMQYCGLLNLSHPFSPAQVDPLFLEDDRQEKLDAMIIIDIFEQDEGWLNYQDEESIVQLEITDLIFHQLIDEVTQDLIK